VCGRRYLDVITKVSKAPRTPIGGVDKPVNLRLELKIFLPQATAVSAASTHTIRKLEQELAKAPDASKRERVCT
jgi:hypothetical protein